MVCLSFQSLILFCSDVTDETALRLVHQTIVETSPPIAGVLNGAMVLRDISVRNMTLDHVTDVVRPKVDGSIYLDQIFHDMELDFFILLSSMNCVCGHAGQANYAAANMGMCGVAANRRRRGLASVAVNVGTVIGAGYITESGPQVEAMVDRNAMMHLSEEDFHQIFAEAMEAGFSDSAVGPEISTGLLNISPDSINVPKWSLNPKFANIMVHETAGSGDKEEQSNAASIQDRLQACRTKQEVLPVIKGRSNPFTSLTIIPHFHGTTIADPEAEAFAAQLRKILQSSTADEDLLIMRGVELGLDSLIAVDIRAWFLKNVQVSIPVLKIMSQDVQMISLAESAAEGIPAKLVPLISGDETSAAAGDKTATANGVGNTDGQDGRNDDASRTPTIDIGRSNLQNGDTHGDKIDWEAESCPPNGIPEIVSSVPPNPKPSIILLTGVSGLLGHHIFNSLLEQTSIHKIICVAVRHLSKLLEEKQLPPPNDRISYYEGDLRQPQFGLSEKDVTAIFTEIDAVIHMGSDMSHLKYYSAIRATNVLSTHQLVRLCLPRMIPLHYISSIRISHFAATNNDTFAETSATTGGKYPPSDGRHGYMCGKWACERLLERANEKYGLPVWIQRPSHIIREGSDATAPKAEFDSFTALVEYAHRIRAVPEIQHGMGAIDLVYVQTVCEDVVRELVNNSPKSAHGVTYINNVGDIVVPVGRLKDMGMRRSGTNNNNNNDNDNNDNNMPYEVLPMEEWARKAIAAGMHEAMAALIETLDEPEFGALPTLLREKVSRKSESEGSNMNKARASGSVGAMLDCTKVFG